MTYISVQIKVWLLLGFGAKPHKAPQAPLLLSNKFNIY
ncbi:hypothetical protein M2092_000984 [Fusobacterium sp. PH5-44]